LFCCITAFCALDSTQRNQESNSCVFMGGDTPGYLRPTAELHLLLPWSNIHPLEQKAAVLTW